MKLETISVENFRSLKKVENIPIHQLTILIGENDSGKSSLIDILEFVLNGSKKCPQKEDFSVEPYTDPITGEIKTKVASKIEVILKFSLDSEDKIPDKFLTDNKQLVYKACYSYSNDDLVTSITYCLGQCYKNDRFNTFHSLKSTEKDSFLKELGIGLPTKRNDEIRRVLLEDYLTENEILTHAGWVEVKNELADFLPRFEKYSSADYKNPESLIHKTLYSIVEAYLYTNNRENGEKELLPMLRYLQSKMKQNCDSKVQELKDFIIRYNSDIQDVEVIPQIDFAKSFQSGQLRLEDASGGFYAIERKGEGTRKRLFLSILDWERKVLLEEDTRPVIRGYDEPDTNLHYEAQRRMYYSLRDITHKENSKIQAIICTHSLTMIDRAPAKSINLLQKDSSGNTFVKFLSSSENAGVEMFLSEMTNTMGISNSSIFYDRCFILVEGPTEENSLPIFYKTLYETSMLEDGIRLVNMHGCGNWKNYINLLGNNKKDLMIFLLDQDCQSPSSNNNLTLETLTNFGFDDQFISNQIVFIGTKEFEDSFDTSLLLEVLNTYWPKATQTDWLEEDINALRMLEKFSEELVTTVRVQSRMEKSDQIRKASFGIKLAQHCTKENIPQALSTLFEKAREIAGVTQPQAQELSKKFQAAGTV